MQKCYMNVTIGEHEPGDIVTAKEILLNTYYRAYEQDPNKVKIKLDPNDPTCEARIIVAKKRYDAIQAALRNYEKLVKIYKNVAEEYGLVVPDYFISLPVFDKERYGYIVEPLDPIIYVDVSNGPETVSFDELSNNYVFESNKRKRAEQFFMFDGYPLRSWAMSYVNGYYPQALGVISNRWRIVS